MMGSQQDAAMERYNYYNDSRVQESMRGHAYVIRDAGPGRAILIPSAYLVENEDDDPDFVALQAQYEVNTAFEVCYRCSGSGTMVNPSIDCGGISQDQFDDDPDFYDSYMSGAYDQTCSVCNGKRVVPDEEKVLRGLPEGVMKRLLDFQRDMDDDRQERMAELRMGC